MATASAIPLTELRAIKRGPNGNTTYVGHYDDLSVFETHAKKLNEEGCDIYSPINPLRPGCFTAVNLPPMRGIHAAGTRHIDRRVWLPYDIDAIRPKGQAATRDEKKAAHAVAKDIVVFWRARSVEPMCVDSGNGYQVRVPIDLPNDDKVSADGKSVTDGESTRLIKAALVAHSAEFSTTGAKIDVLYDAPRIMRVPGYKNVKGDNSPERPQRVVKLLNRASGLASREMLEAIGGKAPDRPSSTEKVAQGKGKFTFENTERMLEALAARNPKFSFERARTSCGPGWKVACWNSAQHTEGNDLDGSTVLWVNDRGFADTVCSHSHCNRFGWKDFVPGWGAADLQKVITSPTPNFGSGVGMDEEEEAEVSLPFFSDQALAELFTQANADQIAYTDRGKWATFDNGLWVDDPNDLSASYRAGRFLTRKIFPLVDERTAGLGLEEDALATLRRSIKNKLCSANLQRNVVSLAKQRPGIFHKSEEFDSDEFLIGAPNGKVIDLHTGKSRPAMPSDLIMKSVSVEPSEAPCPRWKKFVDEITDGDVELAQYLQRMTGSWLTASPKDHTLTVWHGVGGNGKGTYISVTQQILGPYSTTIPVDSLVTKKSGDTDLGGVAMLCGTRLAVAQEGETTRRFNAGLLKTLTGGDRLTGKVLYENKFEFKPTHKLVILTNNKPRIDLDGGIRRRLHLVPFTRSFEAVKNVNLKEDLLEEAGSILQWMVEGCLSWQRDGLAPPSSVTDYTNEYFEEADDLKNWIEQNCIRDRTAWTANADLFADWKMFCQEARNFVGNQKDLIENLVREGFQKKRNTSGDKRGISGLKIRNVGIAA